MVGTPHGNLQQLFHDLKILLSPGSNVTPDDYKKAFSPLQSEDTDDKLLEYISKDSEVINLIINTSDEVETSIFVDVFCPLFYFWIKYESKASLRLVSNFIPIMIFRFLSSIAEAETNNEVSTCILHLTNILSDKSNFGFRMPSVQMASVYHHPAKLQLTGGMTDSSVSKGFSMEPIYNESGPQNFTELTSCNRLHVLSILLQKYYYNIGSMVTESLNRLSWMSIWFVASGMPSNYFSYCDTIPYTLSSTPFTVTSEILNAILSCVHFSLFNGLSDISKIAIDAIKKRAEYEVLPEVMLTTRSLFDQIAISTVAPHVKPFGISMPQLQGTINDRSSRQVRGSFIKPDDIGVLRKRMSSADMLKEDPDERRSPASAVVDVTDSDESDIHIASFRGGKLQNHTSV